MKTMEKASIMVVGVLLMALLVMMNFYAGGDNMYEQLSWYQGLGYDIIYMMAAELVVVPLIYWKKI